MGQHALLVFETVGDPAIAPLAWTEIAGAPLHIIQCGYDEPDAATARIGAAEADYCWARAKDEARRTAEARHPAARNAHLQMAVLYNRRALAALAIEGRAAQDWMKEVGNWPLDR
jgi:hypothetical protein